MIQMLELFQTEWCPSSRRVRQRLTERMLSIVGNDELAPVATEVKERLGAVVERACTA